MADKRKEYRVVLPLLALYVVGFLAIATFAVDTLAANWRFQRFDFYTYFLPKFHFGSSQIAQGHLPIWNALEFGGIPFLATAQPAALYLPKVVIFGLFEAATAMTVFLWVHYLAMAGFFLIFVRDQDVGPIGALVGASFWTLSGVVLGSNFHPVRIANLVWVPLILLFASRIFRGKGGNALVGLAAVIAIQLTAGYPEFSIDTGILVVVLFLVYLGTESRTTFTTTSLTTIIAAYVLAALVASIQLLPLAELAVDSGREAFAELHAAKFVFGLVMSFKALFLAPLLGLLPLIVLGIFSRRSMAPLAGVLFCFLMFWIGWMYLRQLPGLGVIRFPFVWEQLATVYLAWLAALGADQYLEYHRKLKGKDRTRLVANCAAVGWMAFCVILISSAVLEKFQSGECFTGCNMRLFIDKSLVSTLTSGIGGILLAMVFVTKSDYVSRRRLFLGAISLVIAGHLAGYPNVKGALALHQPQTVGKLASLHGNADEILGRTFSIYDLYYGYTITDGIPSVFGNEASFMPGRFRPLVDSINLSVLLRTVNWQRLAGAEGFLDAMNLEYLVAPRSQTKLLESHGLLRVRKKGKDGLFENPDKMGPAWISYRARVVANQTEAMDFVMGRDFDPRKEVVLEVAPANPILESTEPGYKPVSGVQRISDTEFEYSVKLDRPGILVVSESGYPGWSVQIDGNDADWLYANYVLRGVELDPGRHKVRFWYRPWSITVGMVVTCIGLLMLGAIPLYKGWTRKSEASSTGAL